MKLLYDEASSRFPEALCDLSEGNEDLPYVVMGSIVDWLSELKLKEMDSTLIQRVVDFKNWCENQPRGKDAGDDIWTIYTVALFEKLFRHETTRLLIPHLASKEALVHNAAYLKSWVGEKNYELVLASY